MNLSRSKSHLALLLSFAVLAASPARLEAQGEENPRLLPAAQPAEALTLQWNGRPGRTYFLQQSHDLHSWTYLDTIHHGDGVKMHGVLSTGQRYFLRLRHSDIPCEDPALADFDNDGLNNGDELFWLTDPFNPDSDGDGFKDGWEVLSAWNPTQNDAAKIHLDDDGDGLDNLSEHAQATHPGNADSDGDGLPDLLDAAPLDSVVNWKRGPEPVYAAMAIPAAEPPAPESGPPAPGYGEIKSCNSLGEVLADTALWKDGVWVPLKQTMAPVEYTFRRQLPEGGTSEEPMILQMIAGSGSGWAVDDHGGVLGMAQFPQAGGPHGGPQETPYGDLPVYWPSPESDPVLVGFPAPGATVTDAQLPYESMVAGLSPDGFIVLNTKFYGPSAGPTITFWSRGSPHQQLRSYPGLSHQPTTNGTMVNWYTVPWLGLASSARLEGGMTSGVAFASGASTGLRWFNPDGLVDTKNFTSPQSLGGWLLGRVDKKMFLPPPGQEAEDKLFLLETDNEAATRSYTRGDNNVWHEAASLRGAGVLRCDGVALALYSNRLWRNGQWKDLGALVPDSPPPAGELYRARAFPEGGLILATRDAETALYEQGPASLLFPVELVTRDRFFAGSLRIPEGWDDLELSFHNTTNGEDYGQWGDLISSGGNTVIHANLTDILAENGTIQSEEQKVWFVRDQTDHRRLYFYTCFEAHGRAELRLHRGGQMLGKVSRDLVFEPIMDRWIRGLDAWVDGRAFGLVPPPASGGFFVSTGNEQPSGLPEGGSSIFDLPADGKLDHLTRALLVPVFSAITGVKGAEALFRGLIDGIKSGLNDDWEFILAIKNGAVLAGAFAWQAAETEIQRWRDDPLTRSRELMAAIIQGVNDHIVQPLAEQAPAMHVTSIWELRDRLWNHAVRISQQIANGAAATWDWAVNAPQKLASSLTGWLDNLAGRMGQQAEQFIWTNSPWHTDPLFAGAEAAIVTAWYSLGYCSGYISEQIVIGIVTGGVGKIAVVLAKAGGQAAFQLAKRAISAGWFRMHLLKKTMAEAVISQELRIAIERGLAKAAKEPLSATIRDCPAEIIEAALARDGFARATFSTKFLIDEIGEAIYIKKLCQTPGREAQFWHRLALYFQIMGDNATANASKGLVRSYNRLLKFEGDELIEDRLGDLFTALRCESLAEGRQLARDSMEEFATRAAPTRGNEAFKLSANVAEVYPELYHYKPARDFRFTRVENGIVKMNAHSNGHHYLTPEPNATPGTLQLPEISGLSVEERARYRLKFQVEQIKERLEIPYSNDLHNGGVTDRLEPIVRDNPNLGPGGCVQFTTNSEIVIDEVFDTILQRNLTTAEVQQLINNAINL